MKRNCLERPLVTWWLAAMIGVALASLACQGPRLVVEVNEPAEAGWGQRSPTWDWQPAPNSEGAPWFEAPEEATGNVHPRLRKLVARALGARGFVHSIDQPDMYVRYQLSVRRTREVTYEQRSPRIITGSLIRGYYEVRGVVRVERDYDDVRLEIHVARAQDEHPVWVARLRERLPESFEPHLASAVTSLFERFPQAPSTAAGRSQDVETP